MRTIARPFEVGKAIGMKMAILEKEHIAEGAKAKEANPAVVIHKVKFDDPAKAVKVGLNSYTGISLAVARDGFKKGYLLEKERTVA